MIAAEHINEVNVSSAWIKYAEFVSSQQGRETFHAVVQVQNPAIEDRAARDAIEAFLSNWSASDESVYPVHTVASTIFPINYAKLAKTPQDLALMYRADYKKLRDSNQANKYGTYFGRIVQTQTSINGKEYDQLNDTIAKLKGGKGNRTRTEIDMRYEMEENGDLSVTTYETERNHARTMGFPCMSHLAFQRDEERLHIVAFYRNQDVGRKAYGNLLGLGRLCKYVAEHSGLVPGTLTMVAGHAYFNSPKQLADKHLPLIRAAVL